MTTNSNGSTITETPTGASSEEPTMMTTKTMYPDGHVTELRDDGRQFIWYPRGERHVIDAAQFATFDQRDARIAELWSALYRIRVLASDAAALEGIDRETLFAAIRNIAAGALMTEPERDMQIVSEELGY